MGKVNARCQVARTHWGVGRIGVRGTPTGRTAATTTLRYQARADAGALDSSLTSASSLARPREYAKSSHVRGLMGIPVGPWFNGPPSLGVPSHVERRVSRLQRPRTAAWVFRVSGSVSGT